MALHASGTGSRSWKGDDIEYRSAHTRITSTRGRASEHGCVMCPKQAQQWAYDFGDEPKWATFGRRTIPYSPNPHRYQPLCRGCHVKVDRYGYALTLNEEDYGALQD